MMVPLFMAVAQEAASGGTGTGLYIAAVALLALAVVALFVLRRRSQAPRLITIVETTSLGPRRSLVVARLADELLLLGSSEQGIALLATRPVATPSPPLSTATPGFDDLLAESSEALELRSKLAGARETPL